MNFSNNSKWHYFDNVLPEPNRKIKIDFDGDIFESETKMLENMNKEIILMANMTQPSSNDFFVGMNWFPRCKWCYNDI